jgi:hypothetical protein
MLCITGSELGAALSFHFPNPVPTIRVFSGSATCDCKLVDVGPWNTNDPYWESGARPEASGTDKSVGMERAYGFRHYCIIVTHSGDECWTSIQSPFLLKQSLSRVAVPGARPARRQSAANPRSRKARETETKSDDADETNVDAVSSEGAV